MKIEKLTEDKIRITLNLEDLESKNIDFHSFMANSPETQHLFLEMLDKVEKEIGFVTKNYKLSIEAVATQTGHFILTITRLLEHNDELHKKVHIKRKLVNTACPVLVYQFDDFDNLCLLCEYIKHNEHFNEIISLFNNISLYYYNTYYLVFTNIYLDSQTLKNISAIFSEFGKYVHNSNLFEKKLKEFGTVIMPHHAIDMLIDKFVL